MIAYFDLPSGLSGDMILGCLIDAGWSAQCLRQAVESLALPADQWAVQVQQVCKGSLRATQVDVLVEETTTRRRLADIAGIIHSSTLPSIVKERAIAVFVRLASAEAKVHGTTPDQIHFHEVGALDSLVDIVGCVSGLHDLGIERLYCSAVPLGHGWTNCAHGRIPLPAPATLELLSAASVPTVAAPGPGELLTPTAAALLAEFATFTQPAMSLSRIGVGAGRRDFAWPNIARLWLGEAADSSAMVQLETNIDDMNPQLYAAVTDKLFAAGAVDVWLSPVQMKKGRPGIVLSALASASHEARLVDVMMRQTTTLGVRVQGILRRHEAAREFRELHTPFGSVRGKIKRIGTEPAGIMPEYDDCRSRAESADLPVRVVYESAVAAAQEMLTELREAHVEPKSPA